MTSARIQTMLSRFLDMTQDELDATIKNPSTTMIEKYAGALLSKGIEVGDPTRLNFIFDRIVGKVTDKVEVTTLEPFILNHRTGGQTIMGAKLKDDDNS